MAMHAKVYHCRARISRARVCQNSPRTITTMTKLPYELFIGLRYTRDKRRNHFISFILLTSMLGIALGGAGDMLSDWQAVAGVAAADPRVVAAAPYVNVQGMLTFDGAVRGALIRGILPEQEEKVAEFGSHMKSGSLDALKPGEFGIVLGAELARALAAIVGDKVTLIAPQGQVTPAGIMPRLKQFRVVGIFEVGMFEYDSGLALVDLQDAQKLYRMADQVSGVRLKLRDLFQSRQVAYALLPKLGADVHIN